MRTIVFIFLAAFTLLNCSSESEQQGIDDIASFYGCNVSCSYGTSISTSEGKKKYVELQLSDGEGLSMFDGRLIASNATRLFYNSLTEEEKNKYTHISADVEQTLNGMSNHSSVEFRIEHLALVAQKEQLFRQLSDYLKDQDYDKFFENTSSAIKSDDVEKLKEILPQIEEKSGEMTELQITGFQFIETEGELEGLKYKLIKFSGIQKRSIQNIKFSIFLSQEPEDDDLFGVFID